MLSSQELLVQHDGQARVGKVVDDGQHPETPAVEQLKSLPHNILGPAAALIGWRRRALRLRSGRQCRKVRPSSL